MTTSKFIDNSGLNVDWDASAFTSKNSNWKTREGDVRKEIYKMTKARSNISFVYKESLRSMIASFNDVGYISSEDKWTDIKCIHANAERAVAKLKQENNIILPILSIGQTVSDNDTERQKTESLLVNEKYWDKEKNRAIRILSLAPRAVNVRYQLNIWTKYMADMDQILEQIRLKFNPAQVPDGIRVTYNSQVYNKLSSPVDGYHASTNGANPTYIGATAFDCGLVCETDE